MTCGSPTVIRVDILLSRSFEVVERTIFRLVLNGRTDIREIRELLRLFSRPVIANGIRNLVNRQVLSVDVASGTLRISEPLVALLCAVKEPLTVELQSVLAEVLHNDGFLIVGAVSRKDGDLYQESRDLKLTLLQRLLPGINLDLYVDAFDFALFENEGDE